MTINFLISPTEGLEDETKPKSLFQCSNFPFLLRQLLEGQRKNHTKAQNRSTVPFVTRFKRAK